MRLCAGESLGWLVLSLTLTVLHLNAVSATCEISIVDGKRLYNYSLASPTPKYPHGVRSEDGYYKVAANGTVLWFQLCDAMIFNHDPPMCIDCRDCGGPSHCGMGCSALMVNKLGGYPVCTTIGRMSSMLIDLLDEKNPHMGVVVKLSTVGLKVNCSLAVSVFCDSSGLQEPKVLEKVGTCDFATQLRHPSGCAQIISVRGKGLGWFGTLVVIILCLFGGYLLAGTVYRFFYLGIRGIDVIPNLEFWASIPHRVQSSFMSLLRRFRGPSEGYRNSYSPVNF
ncbi:hypothetical protein NMG60_11018349 [Bertholletia excelsa]